MSRRYYRGTSLTLDWDDSNLMERMFELSDRVSGELGDIALATAKALAPVATGKLKSEIELKKSQFEGGGCVVVAQGPGNYDKFYASFVELGTDGRPAQPYLRPAIKKVRRIMKRTFQDAITND